MGEKTIKEIEEIIIRIQRQTNNLEHRVRSIESILSQRGIKHIP